MSIERAAMRGKLAEAQDKEKKLTLKVEGLCTAIRQSLNTALTPVDELDVPQTAQQMDDLVVAWTALILVQGDITRLEKELR